MAECEAIQLMMLSRDRDEPDDAALKAHLAGCTSCQRTARQLGFMDRALAALAAEGAPVPPFERIERRALAAARGRRQARLVRRILPMPLVFAIAVAATIGVTRFIHRADGGTVAGSGDVLDASRGTVQATLADGARLTLPSGRATVEVSEALRGAIRLERGSVLLDVPHLQPGATFSLVTDEVEVRDRGTRFEVVRLTEGTRVNVTQGVVEIRPRGGAQRPFLLKMGETCLVEGQKHVRERARTEALASLDQRDETTIEAKLRAWLEAEPPAEEAAHAHALLGWKLSRDGDRAGAVVHYRRALSLLPRGAGALWADNACAQLALLVEHEGVAEGAAAWRDYLDRFPDGVHAAMARDRLAPAKHRP